MDNRTYLCIDLKSFYASVECIERNLDPMTTNLVVADGSRTEKTICLAVTPSLKAYGISGRARLFEVVQRVKEVNNERRRKAPNRTFTDKSENAIELSENPALELSYIVAPPRMAHYMEYSTRIYDVYLKYISADDILVYSIDEVFMDITSYLNTYKMTAHELAMKIIRDVLATTGITATAGIGTNMYLAKIAMDIKAKKMPADKDGVRIAELDEMSYRRELWTHRPLTDFWRVGAGYSRKLEANRFYTMGDIARASTTTYGENQLYKLFGINAELLIDHAWGWEPCTIADAKAYKPENKSISTGQVLQSPYSYENARLIVREMTDLLVLDLVDKGLVTDHLDLAVGYDTESLKYEVGYTGEVINDYYGRKVPKGAHGSVRLSLQTSSTRLITEGVMELYDRIVSPQLLVRRINLTACGVVNEQDARVHCLKGEQLDMFTDYEALEKQIEAENAMLMREKRMQKAVIELKKRYGKNIILRGMNLCEAATARERNAQIGGHKA